MTKPSPLSEDEKVKKEENEEEKKGDNFERRSANKVKQSKFTRLNYMTIPQMKAGKEILKRKLSDPNLNKTTELKLRDLYNEYENTERKINKYYQAIETNPLTRGFRTGQRNLLTISLIKNNKLKHKNRDKDLKYNAIDWMRDVKMDKIALGIGIAAMTAGTLTAIKIGEKTIMSMIGEVLKDFIINNPAAFGLLAGGAALIAASKIIPAIDRKARNIAKHKAQISEMQNSLSDEASTHEHNVDKEILFNKDISEADIASLAETFVDNPTLMEDYKNVALNDKNRSFTRTQKINILKAIKAAKELKNGLDKEKAEVTGDKMNTGVPEYEIETGDGTGKPKEEEPKPVLSENGKKFQSDLGAILRVTAKKDTEGKEIPSINRFIAAVNADKSLSKTDRTELIAMAEKRKEAIKTAREKAGRGITAEVTKEEIDKQLTEAGA